VTDPSIVSSLPVMHWFVSSPESADTTSGTRGALFYGGELYDNIKFFIHGQSTAGFPKKSYNVDFNDSHRFRMTPGVARMPDVNLLTNWADKTKVRNTLAYAALAAAGVGHHLAFPVRVQQNGAFFSVADLVEDGDGHWLERLGKDPDGALYKMYDALDNVANAEKKTRKYEGKDDLQAVIDALSQNASSRAKWVWDHVDIPGMVGFAAGLVLVSDGDCCHKNYYAYRDTNGTGEWVYLPWDVDLTFGHNWTFQYNYFDETYYYDNALWAGGNSRILKACFEQADFKAMVVRRLRTMMDELFQSTGAPLDTRWMESTIAAIQAQIGDDADLDADAWGLWGTPLPMDEAIDELLAEWFPARRGYLYDTLVTSTHDIPAAQPADATLTIASFDASPAAPTQGYIQLHNASTTLAIDLTDARLTGDVSFTMRPGTVIAPNGDLWLVADVNGFRARASSPKATEKRFVQGAWNGTLRALRR
ncbi:MAG: CotH kinase family protein, partial [Myxococcota bacterium]